MRFLAFLALLPSLADLIAQEKSNLLPKFDPNVLAMTPESAKELQKSLQQGLRERREAVNKADLEAWRKIENRKQWETFRDARIEALRKSLGEFPPVPKDMPIKVIKTIERETHLIDCLLYESRKGFWVSANLYRPKKVEKKSAGIIIIHSHHNPKTEGELQDMGVTWAKAGATVLIPDLFGHGERRIHNFVEQNNFPKPYRISRQDYWFRYYSGMHLSLLGESLIGWFAWDTMRGVDVLLKQKGVDPEKIVLLGSVAGGGDPAAVTAALDPRIQYLVPFNFGGPQPETKYPLPDDAELTFNYMGSGSWESTRNLAGSAKGGFLPWVIVASVAPRGLIHAHEFAWDQKRDPVWARYQTIWKWTESDKLSFTHGRGSVTGSAPESTHCNNIGLEHRKAIHATFEKWLDLKVEESKDRLPAKDLLCWTPEARKMISLGIEGVPEFNFTSILDKKTTQYIAELDKLSGPQRLEKLRQDWTKLLALDPAKGIAEKISTQEVEGYHIEKWTIVSDVGHKVPVLLLCKGEAKKRPVVVGITGLGKEYFLTQQSETLKRLLDDNIAVCLFDPRWTGEVRIGNDRGRQSALTAISASELMLGTPIMGQRLEDTLAVLDFLKDHKQIDAQKMILWGESFAKTNEGMEHRVPMDYEDSIHLGDSAGSTLALLAHLFRPQVKGVISRGGLSDYRTFFSTSTYPFVRHSHDVMIPDIFSVGDLLPLWRAIPVNNRRIEFLLNGTNRTLNAREEERFRAQIHDFPKDEDYLILLRSKSSSEELVK